MSEKTILTEEDVLELFRGMPEVALIATYGSAWFTQAGHDSKEKKTYDLIVFINGPQRTWHQKNYEQNPEFYTFMGKKTMVDETLPPTFLKKSSEFKDNFSCMYFDYNKHCEIKTLIVSADYALRMLKSWEHFSIPGRLQKEIKVVYNGLGDEAVEAIYTNNRMATICALLLCEEEKIPLDKFNETRVNLSYLGDVRMKTGAENPDKVKNISQGSESFFKGIYDSMDFVRIEDGFVLNYNNYYQNAGFLIDELPETIKTQIEASSKTDEEIRRILLDFFSTHNELNSGELAYRCFWTNGAKKSIEVVVEKLKKQVNTRLYKIQSKLTAIFGSEKKGQKTANHVLVKK